MIGDWETDVLWPSKLEKAEEIMDSLGWEYDVVDRGRLSYLIIKGQRKEEISRLFDVEG